MRRGAGEGRGGWARAAPRPPGRHPPSFRPPPPAVEHSQLRRRGRRREAVLRHIHRGVAPLVRGGGGRGQGPPRAGAARPLSRPPPGTCSSSPRATKWTPCPPTSTRLTRARRATGGAAPLRSRSRSCTRPTRPAPCPRTPRTRSRRPPSTGASPSSCRWPPCARAGLSTRRAGSRSTRACASTPRPARAAATAARRPGAWGSRTRGRRAT